MTDREKVLRVMRAVADTLRVQRGALDGALDDEAVSVAIATACDRMAISPHDYHQIVESDELLEELEQRAITDSLTQDADPGPYAAISREASSGRPGELSRSLQHPIPPWRS